MPYLTYATTGPGRMFNAIGWFNFDSLPNNLTVAPQLTIKLSNNTIGGGKVEGHFTFTSNRLFGLFAKQVPPFNTTANFANTAYLGITLPVCMVGVSDGTLEYGSIEVTDLIIRDRYGQCVDYYDLYCVETFTTNDEPWQIFDSNIPIIKSNRPTTIRQTITSNGGFVLGFSFPSIKISVQINDRIDPADQFILSLNGAINATTITQSKQMGIQPEYIEEIIGQNLPAFFTFNEVMAQGSVSNIEHYNPIIKIVNLSDTGTSIPSTLSLGEGITLSSSDIILATIINSESPSELTLNKIVDENYSTSLASNSPVCEAQSISTNNVQIAVTVPAGNVLKLSMGNVAPSGLATVSFRVKVNTIPNANPIPNSGNVAFVYTVNPSTPNGKNSSVNTNIVNTQVNNGNLTNVVKDVNKAFARINDVLTYTITVPNTGTISTNNVIFRDTIPNETSFIAGSVLVNGISQPGATVSYPNGLSLGTIGVGASVTLSFKTIVTTIPMINFISNTGNVTYSYVVDPIAGTTIYKDSDTNMVATGVNDAIINSNKRVTPTNCIIGNTLFYTVTLTNSGNVTANNVVFIDTIPNGTNFIDNSLAINGSIINGENPSPPNGVTLPNIAPNGVVTVTFRAMVNNVLTPSTITNSSSSNYSFVLDPINGITLSGASNSNIASTFVNPNNLLIKTANIDFAKPSDAITYTISLKNNFRDNIGNVVFIDTIANDSTFIANSIKINGTTISGATINPPNGLNVGTIPGGQITTVTFRVSINTIPSPNPIPNQVIATYNYVADSLLGTITTETNISNMYNIGVNFARIDFLTKSVDKTFADISDIITYTISLRNTGNTTANNLLIIDTIPNNTTFEPQSVFINEIQNTTTVPVGNTLRINMGNVEPNKLTTLSFKVKVSTIPSPNPILNTSNVSMVYTMNPSIPNGESNSANSNSVSTKVNNANLVNIIKGTDKLFAKVSDTITYTITIPNIGNVTASNVRFIDTIPGGTSFVANSVLINGLTQSGALVEPPNGLSVGNIGPNSTVTLSFKVTVATIPSINPIPNSGNVTYQYIVNDISLASISSSNNTNTVNTIISDVTINSVKTVTPTNCVVGDTLNYTVVLTNNGNITATNLVFKDTIPSGTSFVNNSFSINGTTITGVSPAPPIGATLPNIIPNGRTTLSFRVLVNTIPTINPIPNSSTTNYVFVLNATTGATVPGSSNSNTVSTFVNPQINTIKTVNKAFTAPGETLTYTISWRNGLNVSTSDVVLIDTIPNDTTFISDSINVNGATISGATIEPPNGLSLGTIPSGQLTTVTFNVIVNTIPSPNPVVNRTIQRYSYISDETLGLVSTETILSTQASTKVNLARINYASKTADKMFAKVGDTLIYTVSFTNTGNITANNIKFIDTIPNNTTFTVNSLFVNGVNRIGETVAPPNGVTIPSLGANQTSTISFRIIIDTIPNPNIISNTGNVSYDYLIDPTTTATTKGSVDTDMAGTVVNYANLGFINKSVDKTISDVGEILTYVITSTNTGNVTCSNVIIVDTIPNNTTFDSQSVFINGVQDTNTVPVGTILRINMGDIVPNGLSTLTFRVKVNTLPSPNPIINSSNSSFVYTINPSIPNGGSGSANSNSVSTRVNNANLMNIVKGTNKLVAKVTDTIMYTITIPNSGNVTAYNVRFIDTIPDGTSFVANSVLINGATQSGISVEPPNGISVGNIGPYSTATLSFKVTIVTIPSINLVLNSGNVTYQYVVDNISLASISASNNTNIAETMISNAMVMSTKTVSPINCLVGDNLNYTVILTNTGNVTATNLVFKDTIPSGTNFITNSFSINGTTITGASPAPPIGVTLPSIIPNGRVTINFKVLVNTVPTINPIPNSSTTSYVFVVNQATGDTLPESSNSNVVSTYANYQTNTIKTVNKSFATPGETLTYTISWKNELNVSTNESVLIDTIPNDTTFVQNSIIVNGTPMSGVTIQPPNGLNLGIIPSGQLTTVTFNVIVNTIPSPNPIVNRVIQRYSYSQDPGLGLVSTQTILSNQTSTKINYARIDSVSKTVDKVFAKVGDTLIYTVSFTNSGNTTANNIRFIDTIPNNTTFTSDSVLVNGVIKTGETVSPPNGVTIPSLGINKTSTISFKIMVDTIPTPNPIPNIGNVSYDYIVDTITISSKVGSINSNITNTQINYSQLGIISKTVDKSFANVGDVLTYIITSTNTGNVTSNNVIIVDTIPNNTTFESQSVFINGIQDTNTVPVGNVLRINMGNIRPNGLASLSFRVKVNTIPNPNPIPNNSSASFVYTINPSIPNGGSNSGNSNSVNTKVNNANLINIAKGTNKLFAKVSDIITYTITIPNIGNVTAYNVRFIDTIPNGTSFVANSVLINGAIQNGMSVEPPNGLSVGSIAPYSTVTLSFNITVFTIPSINPVSNSGNVTYEYIVDDVSLASVPASNNTNTVNTKVNDAIINSTKTVNSTNCVVGDILNYTVILTNSGNVTATNIVFKDTIPSGTNFVTNSLSINGTTITGANPSPPIGVIIPNIIPNGIATISFRVLVNSIPTNNPIPNSSTTNYVFVINTTTGDTLPGSSNSNVVSTYVNQEINTVKTVNKQFAIPGDTLTYRISWRNELNVDTSDVVLIDTIPNDTTFVPNSINVNGTIITGATINPPNGLNLGTIPSGQLNTVTFDVIVNTIPSPNPIVNRTIQRYSYVSNSSLGLVTTKTILSNQASTKVNIARIDSVSKTVDKTFAKVGDTLIYTVSFTNTGSTTADNIRFIDTIPNNTIFTSDSVLVNGVTKTGETVAPPNGVIIPRLGINKTSTISFKVIVDTIPNPNPIPNIGNVSYDYIIDTITISTKANSIDSNTTNTQINYANLGFINKTVDKSISDVGEILTYVITSRNTGNVTCNNVIIVDTIPNNTTFESQSVFINGAQDTNTVPVGTVLRINMGNVVPNGLSTLTFRVKVNALPSPNPILNSSNSSFVYTINPSIPNGGSGSGNSNSVSTKVNNANLMNILKDTDKLVAKVADTITYNINIPNIGNVTASNVRFIDTIPNGTSFIANSVLINGATQSGAIVEPPNGLSIGSIGPYSSVTLSFKVTVATIPSINPIPNSGNVTYQYIVNDVSLVSISASNNTNIVNTMISNTMITSTKTVTPINCVVGDTLNYTVILSNGGNVTATNLVFKDTIPSGTSFIANSFSINGTTINGVSPAPPTGATLPNIIPNGIATLNFRVFVNTVPTINPIQNSSYTNYVFVSNPATGATLPQSSNSNVVSTYANYQTNTIKTVNKSFATVGETLTYTISWKNELNISTSEVVLIDTIPNDTTFIPNSIIVNGTPMSGVTIEPPNGLNLGMIPSGQLTTVTFNVIVNTIPSPNPIVNRTIQRYSYISDPGLGLISTQTILSNQTSTKINSARIESVSKTVDKIFAKVGDTLIYTVSFTNTGNTTANNIRFIDTIPNNTTFTVNSVLVNGVTKTGETVAPPNGVTIPSLGINKTSTISFKIIVDTIPSPNPIPNIGNVSYDYIVDTITISTKASSTDSNITNTQVNYAKLGFISKTVDKSFADVGDTLTYVITSTNTGNVTSNNVVIVDTIPNNTTFELQSVFINGVQDVSTVPVGSVLRINVGNIEPNGLASLSFRIKVNTIPSPNPVPNNSSASFVYTISPTIPNGGSNSGNSNSVSTKINNANLTNIVKGTNKLFAKVSDVITYTITIPNVGNVTASNVIFIDTIPDGTSFVNNSVLLRGLSQSGALVEPPNGLSVGSIGPYSSVTLSFKVTVTTIPSINLVTNSGNVTYQYIVDDVSLASITASNNTNTVNTRVNDAIINSTKTVTPTNCVVGDTLNYTVILTNSGNTTATNLVFKDTIPSGTTFVANSFSINGTTITGTSPAPPTGATLPNIIPSGVLTISFRVLVNTVPTINPILNSSNTNYVFVLNTTTGATLPGSSNSNIVSTSVNPEINTAKTVNKQFATPGDTLTYRISWRNELNVDTSDVVLIDTIPNDTTFVSDSINVNGTPITGATINPPNGLSLGTIPSGQLNTVTFDVIVNTIPSPNPVVNRAIQRYSYVSDPSLGLVTTKTILSNQTNTKVNLARIDSVSKTVDKDFAKVGDTLIYTVSFTNTGNTTANNLRFIDTIPNNTTFTVNSVLVNGVTKTGETVAPPNGVTIPSLGVNRTSTVSFKVIVDTIPNPNPIPNIGNVSYDYVIDTITISTKASSTDSNTTNTQINYAKLGFISKTVDKSFADVGDTLTYVITSTNTGNVTSNNVIIVDTIPNNTTFEPQSVFINGVQDTSTVPVGSVLRINVGNIEPSGLASLSFRVKVNTIPSPNPVPNNSSASFVYTISPTIPNGGSNSGNSNSVSTKINNANLMNIVKGADKLFAKGSDVITYTVTIPNMGNVTSSNVVFIDTIPDGTSFIANSVLLRGLSQSGALVEPPNGLSVGSIGPYSSVTLSFKVMIATIPSVNLITNSGNVTYEYIVDNVSLASIPASNNTNTINTVISNAIINSTKTVTPTNCVVGDTLKYTVILSNGGNVTATNLVFKDTIPTGTTFITNSFSINGTTITGVSPAPSTGVTIPNIIPNGIVTLNFRVVVNTLPTINPVPNSSTTNYIFVINQVTGATLPGSSNSNIVSSYINPQINTIKTVNTAFATPGDTLTYTISWRNELNVSTSDVILIDTIPNDTIFIQDSINVNGTPITGATIAPPNGLNLGTIPPGQLTTVTFNVIVNTIPSPNPVVNRAIQRYSYLSDAGLGITTTETILSNQTSTKVNLARINYASKTTDKVFAKVGDALIYTVSFTNTGNITASNIRFIDTIPNNTTFTVNSLLVNGVSRIGETVAPPNGVTIPNLGASKTSTISFKIMIDTIPNPDIISNTGSISYDYLINPITPITATSSLDTDTTCTVVNYANLGILGKKVDKDFVNVNGKLTYTIFIENTGNVTANNVIIKDTIPNNTTFEPQSVFINNVQESNTVPVGNVLTINMGNIEPNGLSTLTYMISVSSVPTPNPIPNNANATFVYTINPSIPNGASSSTNTNTVRTQVNYADLSGIFKSVNKPYATCADILTYTISIPNSGNITAHNIVLYDSIPNGTSLVDNSVLINGVLQPGVNPETGLNIGDIASRTTATISYKVSINCTIL